MKKATTTLTFHLTTDDKRRIKEFAASQGFLTTASFVRFVIFQKIKQENQKHNQIKTEAG